MNRLILIFLAISLAGCSSGSLGNKLNFSGEKKVLTSNNSGKGEMIEVDLTPGNSFYYPLFAVWLEDMEGKYIQTLYVSQSVATGIFKYAAHENNRWVASPKRAPQTLPYWAHKRGIRASDGLFVPDATTTVPDAYTGATPVTGFILKAKADSILPPDFRIMLEINQNWDWNEYWTNDKYPDDENYKMSCQPALVYEAVIRKNERTSYRMKPVGHSHYSGRSGDLFPDLSTLTTALHIADSIVITIK